MTRHLIVLLTLMLLSLSGCNQGSEAPAETETAAEEAIEAPMAEPQTPVDTMLEEQAEAAEEAAEEAMEGALMEMPDMGSELVLCTDPRPEMCAQNYAPVCGQHEDGSRMTYSNSCMACTNAAVVGSLPGACPE